MGRDNDTGRTGAESPDDVNEKLRELERLHSLSGSLIAELIEGEAPSPEPDPAPAAYRVAVVVGHEPTRPGACNRASNLCEFEFNEFIADTMLKSPMEGIELLKVHRHPGTYSALPEKVNALNPDLVLSLHANGYDGDASGTEMLYAEGSKDGQAFAELLQNRVLLALSLPDRGAKSRVRSDRGGTILFGTKAPAVIAEPFFIDNDKDLATANANIGGLVSAYLTAIRDYHIASV